MRRTLAALFTFCFFHLLPLQAAPAPARLSPQDQQYSQQDQSQYQQQDQGPAYDNFSPDQLDNLLSPVALYPDPLLAQLFVAATFPDQVEEAARYVRANGPNGVDDQDWDVSVRAIAHYPTVIGMMADKIDWTTSLGQAYVNQSTDVASSVQHLRHLARTAGNLQSSEQQEVLEHDNYIAISPYQPEYIYVPVYDPGIIYYRRPYYGPAITYGVGFPIGAWLNLDFRWGYGGGWGGVYYTGWRNEGWGNGCWNCGWIGRSRGRVDFQNNVYVNNRYNNINVNRNVTNRNVNENNLNRYNSVHRNVNYNNVQVNNNRANRMPNANNGRSGNGPGNNGNNGRFGNSAGNNGNNGRAGDRPVSNGNNARAGDRPVNTGYNGRMNDRPASNVYNARPNDAASGSGRGNRPADGVANYGRPNSQPAANRPPATNQNIDRNIDRGNPRIDQYRGRDNNAGNGRPSATPQQPMPAPSARTDNRSYQQQSQNRQQGQPWQGRQAPQSQMTRPAPHTFSPNEGRFDPGAASQRGQASRQQGPAQREQSRPAPAPRGNERRKP
jgi:hypothetical protein